MVIHDPVSHSFKFKVYRKSTNAENYIHFFSFHSQQIKSNIIINFVIRAYRICDPEFLDQELDHIRHIFHKLCYPHHFINKAFSRARKVIFTGTSSNNSNNNNNNNNNSENSGSSVRTSGREVGREGGGGGVNSLGPATISRDSDRVREGKKVGYLSVPYHPKIEKFQHLMRNNCNLVFNFDNTIRKKLTKNNIGEVDKNVGVYEIPCGDCDKVYFGESGRGLDVRIQEHKRAYDKVSQNSVLVKHSWDLNHRINWEGAKIIHKDSGIGSRRLVEGAAIVMGNSIEGNKTFTQEDPFINHYICNRYIKNFNFKNSSVFSTSDAASLSPAQVTGGHVAPPVIGTQAVGVQDIPAPPQPPLRRSRRLANIQADLEARRGVT